MTQSGHWRLFAQRAERCGINLFNEAQETCSLVASVSLTTICWPKGIYEIPPQLGDTSWQSKNDA
jgi:hypothetical protein